MKIMAKKMLWSTVLLRHTWVTMSLDCGFMAVASREWRSAEEGRRIREAYYWGRTRHSLVMPSSSQ